MPINKQTCFPQLKDEGKQPVQNKQRKKKHQQQI